MAESTLLERLRGSELLTPAQLSELEVLPEAGHPDPKILARAVVQRGWLTRFQVSQVATGKGKELFVGPYVLLDRIGEGGMGLVFKARHRHMKRTVALKLMRKEKLASADSVLRFYQEVEAAGQLTHPNIVMAFDAGQAGSTHFFAMEFVEGIDLARLVREKGALSVVQACDFIRQAAVGLQHAHERGLVHRDIKPSNLLVTATEAAPVVKILDLGLARLGDSFTKERDLTRMGQVLGTPDYLAPEQALDARKVDIRADIYSLGCSLYFLLTTRAPFQAESLAELLMKHQMAEPAVLRSLRPDVPEALEVVVRRMMAKKPDQRFGSPAEVALALEPFARGEAVAHARVPPTISIAPPPRRGDDTWAGLSSEGEGVIVRPPARAKRDRSQDTAEEQPRPRRRPEKGNRTLLIGGAIGAGVVVLGLVILGVNLLAAKKPGEGKVARKSPAVEVVQKPVVAPEGDDPPVDPARDDMLFAALGKAVRSGKTTRTRMFGGRIGRQEFVEVPPEGALLIGFEVGIGKWNQQDVVHSLRPLFRTARGRVRGTLHGTPQRETVTLEARRGYAVGGLTINAGLGLDGLALKFMAIEGSALNPDRSYDSEWAGGVGGVRQTLAGDGSPVLGVFGKVHLPDAVANGLGLVTLSRPGGTPVTPVVIQPPVKPATEEAVAGEVRSLAPPENEQVPAVTFSSDGKQALSLSTFGLAVHDLSTGKRIREVRRGIVGGRCMAATRDWKQVLIGTDHGVVRRDMSADKELPELEEGKQTNPLAIAVSPDGKYAAAGPTRNPGQDAEVFLWNLETGKIEHRFGGAKAATTSLIFTDDGKYLVASSFDVSLRVWELKTKKPATAPLPRLFGPVNLAAAGESRVLLGALDGAVQLWDCDSGGESRTFSGKQGSAVHRLTASPDHQRALSLGAGYMKDANGMQVLKDFRVHLWDVEKGSEVGHVDLSSKVEAFAFSPDGKFALISDRKLIHYVDLAKIKPGSR